MKIIVIIQARMTSTRLPGKIMLPLGESNVLDYGVTRCKQLKQAADVIVATSTLPADDAVVRWCRSHDTSWFRGSLSDVLSRYYECARPHQPDYVIRVTSDCPFIDYDFGNVIIQEMLKRPGDIVIADGPMPRGLVIEMLSFEALERIHSIGQEPRHREHVTYYAYERLEQFQVTSVPVPKRLQHPEFRITLDTPEDLKFFHAVTGHFGGDRLVPSQKVVDYLIDHPEVARINAHIQQKPVV